MVVPRIYPATLRKMHTGETDGIGGGQFVPHFLVMRDSRILPLTDKLWLKSGQDPDKYTEEVFEYVTKNVDYAFDEDVNGLVEYVQMPYETLQLGRGDCDCSAALMVSMLIAKGIPSHMTFGYAGGGSHRWPEVKYKGDWYVFDTTNGEVFLESESGKKSYVSLFYVTPHSFRPTFSPFPIYIP